MDRDVVTVTLIVSRKQYGTCNVKRELSDNCSVVFKDDKDGYIVRVSSFDGTVKRSNRHNGIV